MQLPAFGGGGGAAKFYLEFDEDYNVFLVQVNLED